jgi:hypothetical protein
MTKRHVTKARAAQRQAAKCPVANRPTLKELNDMTRRFYASFMHTGLVFPVDGQAPMRVRLIRRQTAEGVIWHAPGWGQFDAATGNMVWLNISDNTVYWLDIASVKPNLRLVASRG